MALASVDCQRDLAASKATSPLPRIIDDRPGHRLLAASVAVVADLIQRDKSVAYRHNSIWCARSPRLSRRRTGSAIIFAAIGDTVRVEVAVVRDAIRVRASTVEGADVRDDCDHIGNR